MYVGAPQRPARRLSRRLASALRDERGFTLVELLVATAAAMVVTGALGAIVVTSVHFGSNFSDRVDANQEGRTAMEKIVQQLNSSCVAASVPPIISGATGPGGAGQAISDDSHIWFYSAVAPGIGVTGPTSSRIGATDAATINPALVEVYLSGSQLTETAYPWLSGTAPSPTNTTPWTFNFNAPANFTLLPAASYAAPLDATAPTTATGPIFSYYGYSTGATGTINANPYPSPLSAANAATTAQVVVSFRTLPTDNYSAAGRSTDINDSVVLRLTPASSAATATNSPCS